MYPTLFVLGMFGYNKLEVKRDWAIACYMIRMFRGVMSNPDILCFVVVRAGQSRWHVAAARARYWCPAQEFTYLPNFHRLERCRTKSSSRQIINSDSIIIFREFVNFFKLISLLH